jgi:hypothetical protein
VGIAKEVASTHLEFSDHGVALLNTIFEPQLSSPQKESATACSPKGFSFHQIGANGFEPVSTIPASGSGSAILN